MARSGHPGCHAGCAVALLLAGIVAGAASPASADVFEVSGDGSVHVRTARTAVQQVSEVTSDDSPAPDISDDDGQAPDVPADAVTIVDGPTIPAVYRDAVEAAAAKARISPDLLAALVWQESRWQPSATSAKGAMGLTQLMPSTAAALAVDARDPVANLSGGAVYLRRMLDMFDGDVERALAAYNAGPARVIRAGGVPSIAETRAYVATILNRLARAGAVAPGALRP